MNTDKEYAGALQKSDEYSDNAHTGAEIARARTAAYIEDLLRELETIAAKDGIDPLSDLLRLAKEEARRKAQSA